MFCSPRHFLPTPGAQGGRSWNPRSRLEVLKAVTAFVCAGQKLLGCWSCTLTHVSVFRCSMHKQVKLSSQKLRGFGSFSKELKLAFLAQRWSQLLELLQVVIEVRWVEMTAEMQ